MTTNCQRCGKLCQAGPGNPDARLLRHAQKGRCKTCAIIDWFQRLTNEHVKGAFRGLPDCLRLPHVQDQFRRVMEVGGADLPFNEIDWDEVIEKWNDVPHSSGLLF